MSIEVSNIILNETIKLEKEIAQEWLEWMRKEYLPIFLDSGLVISSQVNRIVQSDPDDGISYAIQFSLKDMSAIHQLHINAVQKAQSLLQEKFNGKYVIFRTMMEVVHIAK